jgi:3-hydroxymyristoyl/3-hydroxydecanoyl-(acyl carrier protein) dehydratase
VTAPATTAPILTTRQIQDLLPHRWPFLLVDRIVEYDAEAKRIVGLKSVTATEWFFQGHFPGQPIMPGVLQVEALAQTMGIYVAQQPGFGDRLGLFAAIDECRFKHIVTCPAISCASKSRWSGWAASSDGATASRRWTATSPATPS